MAVFIRPARVVIDEGGGGLLAAAVAAAAAVTAAVASVIGDIVLAAGVAVGVAVAVALGVLVHVLRRDGVRLYAPVRPASPPALAPLHLGAAVPAAIAPARPAVIPGFVLDEQEAAR